MKAKRWISILLMLALLLSLSAPALALDTEPQPGQKAEEPAPAGITVLDAIQGCSLLDADGKEISLPWIVQDGDILKFRILPAEHYHLGKVLAGEAELTPAAETGLYTVTAAEGLALQIEMIPEPNPVISQPVRSVEGWAQSAEWTFRVTDLGSTITKVEAKNSENNAVALSADETGIYHIRFLENGVCTITAADADGQMATISITEDHIDTTAPELAIAVSPDTEWAQSRTVTVAASDTDSGVKRICISKTLYDKAEDLDSAQDITEIPDADYVTTEVGSYYVYALDNAGNLAFQAVILEKIDTAAPTISEIKRSPATGWAQSVKYSFTAEDAESGIQEVKVQKGAGDAGTVLQPTTDGSYTFTAADNADYLVTVTDNVGNVATASVTEGSIDITAPVIQSVQPQTTWSQSECLVQIVATDNGAIAAITVEDAQGNTYPVDLNGSQYEITLYANGSYTLTVTDAAGNTAEAPFQVSNIDTEAPTKPILTKTPSQDWSNTDITITARAEDTQSGVAEYWYSTENIPFDSNSWTKMNVESESGSLTITQEQHKGYYVVAVDGAGRVSEITNLNIALDKTAPENLTLTYLNHQDSGFFKRLLSWLIYRDKLQFQITAADTASGVVAYGYQFVAEGSEIQPDGWTTADGDAAGVTVTITGKDQRGVLYVQATDLAGNTSAAKTNLTEDGKDQMIVLEDTPVREEDRMPVPDVAATCDSGTYHGEWTRETVTVTVSGSDAASSIVGYEYRIDYMDPEIQDQDWTNVPQENGAYKLEIAQDFNGEIFFRAVTGADNRSKVSSIAVRVQKTAPGAPDIVPAAATGTNGWYTVLPDYEAVLPAQAQYGAPVSYRTTVIYPDGRTETIPGAGGVDIATEGIWYLNITAADAAGNETGMEPVQFRVDITAPTGIGVTLDGEDFRTESAGTPTWDMVNYLDAVQKPQFETYRNGTIHFGASANGGASGLEGIYYQIVSKKSGYNKDGAWTQLADTGLDIAPEAWISLYLKAIDYAGNTTYFNSNGVTLDTEAPVGAQGPELTMIPGTEHRSPAGIYNGDVTLSVAVREPASSSGVYSGLSTISYRILRDGEVTGAGTLYPGSGTETAGADGVIAWDGILTVPAAENNSNNVVVELTATDRAGNRKTTTANLRIDVTAPIITASYNTNTPANGNVNPQIFTGSRTLTLTVQERNFDAAASTVMFREEDSGKLLAYRWEAGENGYTVIIPVAEDGHYSLAASVTDAAGNTTTQIAFTSGTVAGDAFVIDNTPPKISVSYDNNDVANGNYFKAPRTATITVIERNFDANRIAATIRAEQVKKNGSEPVRSAWEHNGITHTATVSFLEDRTYSFAITGQDAAGNQAGPTIYDGAAPTQFVVDTTINAPVITGVEEGAAYAKDLAPAFTALDANLESVSVRLTRTRRNEKNKDVTQEYIGDLKRFLTAQEGGESAVLNVFPKVQENDGIYTLTVSILDKAGNTAESSVTFALCRFGSVYVYNDFVMDLCGAYRQSITDDLVISEFSPARQIAGTARVQILKDGSPMTDAKFEVTPVADGKEVPGSSGWFEYQYVISKDNFTKDGIYSITVSTEDAAGNFPENTEQEIRFAVDTTAPQLTSVTGLEKSLYNADSIPVSVWLLDNIGLAEIHVYSNDKEIAAWTDLDGSELKDSFQVGSGLYQHIRFVATDKAGNVLDTDDPSFAPGFPFHSTITVSSNFFVRWYANRPVFIGSLVALIAVIAGVVLVLAKKKNKVKEVPSAAEK